MHRIGVDVGGTFTDVVTVANGELRVTKVPSTPEAPEEAVRKGVEAHLQHHSIAPGDVGFFGHGTTVATNAVLEGDWAETALITTKGFRDILEIGRQDRPNLYDLSAQKPDPIIPRSFRFGVKERLSQQGEIITPLDDKSRTEIITEIDQLDVDSVAVCLLFSYENDAHERVLDTALKEALPNVSVSRSSEVLPEIREYERTVATALNAALKPVMETYLGNLTTAIADAGITQDPRIMQSNGGSVGPAYAGERPVTTLISGPAAGVQGAAHIAEESGYTQVLTMDMGGTSCDVSLVNDGEPQRTIAGTVGEYTVGIPMIDIHTIGAGGGSIAWIDRGGALRVGPQSAGAVPGPLAYGRGGTQPTVTDAQVVLGRIDPGTFDTDSITPDPAGARDGIEEMIAGPLGMDIEEAAAGILAVANASMERALRAVSVERGFDPRSFALVSFGGAGPLHASQLARSLDIPTVLIPRAAGVLSAFGLVIADIVIEDSVSRVRQWNDVDPVVLIDRFDELSADGKDQLQEEGMDRSAIAIERAVDLRYTGQSFSLRIPVPDEPCSEEMKDIVAKRFHTQYETRYGHAAPDEAIELVTQRVAVRGRVPTPELKQKKRESASTVEPRTTRTVVYESQAQNTPVYDRDALIPGVTLQGPAVIEGHESTAILFPGDGLRVDAMGTIVIETGGGSE